MTTLDSSVDLASQRARAALPAHPKPYWSILESGLHLGYYKGSRACTWYGRVFVGKGKYKQVRLGRSREGAKPAPGSLSYEDAVAALRRYVEAGADSAPAPELQEADLAQRLQPQRLDELLGAWSQERPDVNIWLAGFFLRIEYAHYLHERRVAALSKAAGVNGGDLHVLIALRRNGPDKPMRPTDLFRALLVTSGTITKRLDRLSARRLIERVAASDDRRSELVKLTRRGTEVADQAMTRISTSLSAIVKASGVSQAELVAVDDCFRRLIAKM